MYCKHCGRFMDNGQGESYCKRCRNLIHRSSKKQMKQTQKDEKKTQEEYHRLNMSNAHSVGNLFGKERDKPNMLLDVVGFLLPVLGIIIYFILSNTYPRRAKSLWKFSILGLVIDLFIVAIALVMYFTKVVI